MTAFLCLLTLCLVACGNVPSRGTVTDRYHEDARIVTTFLFLPDGDGGARWVPMTHYDDEDWVLCITGICEPGEVDCSACFEVSPETWQTVQIGDEYAVQEDDVLHGE